MTTTLTTLLQQAQQQTQANRYIFIRRTIDLRTIQQATAGKAS